jgi:hypothetical protein
MKLSDRCQAFATRHDRPGYPWRVWLADWLSGRLRAIWYVGQQRELMMSISQIVSVTKRMLGKKRLTREQALAICGDIHHGDCVSGEFVNAEAVELLKTAFPEFKWRVALDRTGERSRCFVTILADDPREHYTGDDEPADETTVYCIHCGEHHERGVPPKGRE